MNLIKLGGEEIMNFGGDLNPGINIFLAVVLTNLMLIIVFWIRKISFLSGKERIQQY